MIKAYTRDQTLHQFYNSTGNIKYNNTAAFTQRE